MSGQLQEDISVFTNSTGQFMVTFFKLFSLHLLKPCLCEGCNTVQINVQLGDNAVVFYWRLCMQEL